jgi:hypothetical protein
MVIPVQVLEAYGNTDAAQRLLAVAEARSTQSTTLSGSTGLVLS